LCLLRDATEGLVPATWHHDDRGPTHGGERHVVLLEAEQSDAGGFRLGVADTTLAAAEPWMDPPLHRLSLFAAHEDQVQQPPAGARVLGGSDHCPVGAYAIGRHVLCTQYHPELTRGFMRDLLASFGHKFDAQVVAGATSEIEQPVDAALFMQWVARFIEAALPAPSHAPSPAPERG
jgi:GMP synthase (glutamine-hydrolysing)